jgi:DNA polymerase-3 subunit gamma/tau
MANHLHKILQYENFTAEDLALNLIAQASEGSVRDALSMLDQALAINSYKHFLPAKVVQEMLGFCDKEQNISLLDSLLQGDLEQSLNIFTQIQQSNSDLLLISKDLLEIIHQICLIKLTTKQNIDYSESQSITLKQIASKIELPNLLRCWHLITKSLFEISNSISPRLSFEIMLIKICHLISLPDLKKVLLDINNQAPNNSELVSTILQNFEGAKIV